MQATVATERIADENVSANDAERETGARLIALLRHLFLWDRGNQLRVLDETGLSMTQCKAIFEIGGFGGIASSCQLKELAEKLGTSTPAMSRAVDDLVKKSLVTRVEDPDDRRARRIELTAKGHELLDRVLTVRLQGVTAFAASLSAGQRRKLDAAVDALMDREDIAKTYEQMKGNDRA